MDYVTSLICGWLDDMGIVDGRRDVEAFLEQRFGSTAPTDN